VEFTPRHPRGAAPQDEAIPLKTIRSRYAIEAAGAKPTVVV